MRGETGASSIKTRDAALILIDKDSPVYDLKLKLDEMLLKRRTLLVSYTEKNPAVIDITEQIKAVSKELKKELQARQVALDTLRDRRKWILWLL